MKIIKLFFALVLARIASVEVDFIPLEKPLDSFNVEAIKDTTSTLLIILKLLSLLIKRLHPLYFFSNPFLLIITDVAMGCSSSCV